MTTVNLALAVDFPTSVVTHMLPEMSMQKTTRESSTLMEPPAAPPTEDTGAGEMMKVVSDLEGISSEIISTSFLVPQNSHSHTYKINKINHTLTYVVSTQSSQMKVYFSI